jgi:hypothetical protein
MAMLAPVRIFLALFVFAACGESPADPAPRDVSLETEVDASGLSPELSFEIPDGTRSVTVIVEGGTTALYALGAFSMGDGADLVLLPAGSPAAAMQASYEQEQIGHMPGELYQSIRLGTFSHVYPYRPDQVVIAGGGSLRVASSQPGPVSVRILMPEDDGATALPLNFYLVSDTLADPNVPAFTGELQRIFAQVGVDVTIASVVRLTGTALEQITDFNEPQETPASQSAMLPDLVVDRPAAGLDVFFVESLVPGVAGLSLGTPGPPIRGSYYYGVIVRGGFPPVELARITAHEVAHFLALQHIENRGISGMVYPDPLDDTATGVDNLMDEGTVLTPGQGFAISRSAILVPRP